uniref:SWIRM domain-containing protein n=1 Tax=Manihot esculenta TaxID=3983 RepID=A0A2C9U0I4_MANES
MGGEEKKSGARGRSKAIEIGLDSDDDEPIGSLFKLKRHRNPKKVKAVPDKVEAREEKLVAEDDDSGGMDDTLASFRKRLKGPKKDIRSVSVRPLEDNADKGCSGDDLLGLVVNKGVTEPKNKEKMKKTKIDSKRERTGSDAEAYGTETFGSRVEDQKDEGYLPSEGSSHSLDEKLEDSLSTIFHKMQSGSIQKSYMNSCSKQKSKVQNVEGALNRSSECISEFSKPMAATIPRTASTSNLLCIDLKAEDGCIVVTHLSPSDFVSEQSKTMKQNRLDNGFCQSSNCIKGSSDENTESSCKRHARSVEINAPPSVFHCSGDQDNIMPDPGLSNVKAELMVDPCTLNRLHDENCSIYGQVVSLDTQSLKNGLKLCSIGKANTLVYDVVKVPTRAVSVQFEAIDRFSEHKSNKDLRDSWNRQSKDVSPVSISNGENHISFQTEISPPSVVDEISHKSCRSSSNRIHEPDYEGIFYGSLRIVSNSSPNHVGMDIADKTDTGLDFDQRPKASLHAKPHLIDSIISSSKIEETFSECDGPNGYGEKSYSDLVASKRANVATSDGKLPSITAVSGEVQKTACSFQMNDQANSECLAHPNQSSISIQKHSPILHLIIPSEDATKGNCIPNHDYLSINEETSGASSLSITPEENESYPEDAASILDSEVKDRKLSSVQRGARKAKMHRLGDMAYEGDPDWEILINDRRYQETDQFVDGDRSFRMREKSDSSSVSVTEAESGAAAAVLVGLKAHAAGPVEKIKFKEVLKHKGGLQEYLECRNQILGIWSKDVSCILPLDDCGVPDTPSEEESSRDSLIREIYAFLDQSGYINIGIASKKEKKAEPRVKHNYRLVEKNFEVNPGTSVADLEDGVSYILGQFKNSETSLEANNRCTNDNENPMSKAEKSWELVPQANVEVSNLTEFREHPVGDIQQNGTTNTKLANGFANLDDVSCDPFCAMLDSRIGITNPELRNDLQSVHSSSCHDTGRSHNFQGDSEDRKKIIVVGAGPAGLTAARHLQRQGFSVTLLEARNRIGGRVYTDHSSLSVPVDLGASIITGVEADVATERRPDPSSLICAQLGLKLTVLNSDCPLYDIVTREKVPTDLDEALEAEYNSLLDDMVLLIAQKGEHAMKMSLEDGLEYALRSRRMAQPGTITDETELQKAMDNLYVSKTCSFDGGVPEKSCSREDILSPLERRVMDWHFAHLEYGCAALLKEVSLPYWNQDDVYGGFGGAHCMIKEGYSNVVESLSKGLCIQLNHVVTDISYSTKEIRLNENHHHKVKVSASNGSEFFGDAVLITVPLGCLKAETINFNPPLPQCKLSSIQRLGFGVLNKVVLEFPEVFWDDSVDYFGATAEETDQRGHCFMFWNVRKTVGAPVLIALVVGKAAVDGQNMSSSDHVSHALMVLRKLFGEVGVPDPVASVVTDWGRDPFSYGAYSYVAIGSSGEDYDILGRPVENCLFFAGEATCKEHPDTVGGAMMSGLRKAVRIIDILNTGNDFTAEVEAMEAAQRHSECERDEVRDITKRLEAVELSNVLYKNSLDGAQILTREALLRDMFFSAKTTAGRLHLAKKLLNLPVETLKSFAGTRKGLTTLNSWILDSMGKDGTQLLRHCARLLVLVSTDLLAVRLSGIGKTVKEKVCVHTSRDIRAIASQLVSVWLEVFRREKATNGGLKLLRQATAVDSLKRKSVNNLASGKPPLRTHHGGLDTGGSLEVPQSSGSHLPSNANMKKVNGKLVKVETLKESSSRASLGRQDADVQEESNYAMSEEELASLAAAEAAHAAACAAAEAYASTEAKCNTVLQLPKIPSFHKFARREQYAQMEDFDLRKRWAAGIQGRQDCISEIDSRNCRVRDWSVDFSATCVNLSSSRISVDNLSQRSHSNEIACHMNFRELSGESAAADSSLFTRAWVDTAGNEGIKDYHAIERWQSQAAAADSELFCPDMHIKDKEDSNTSSKPLTWKNDGRANESSISQVTSNKEPRKGNLGGADRLKQAVVDFVASLLMPVYKARKIDREGYKSIMKKTATKVSLISLSSFLCVVFGFNFHIGY